MDLGSIESVVEPRHGTDSVFFALIPPDGPGAEAINVRDIYLPELGQNPYLVSKDCLHVSLLDITTDKNLSSRHISSTVSAAKIAASQLQFNSFAVVFEQVLSFRNKKSATHAFVLQMSQGKEDVQTLCEKLKLGLAKAGVHSELKANTPHITLAHARANIGLGKISPIGWKAVSLVLVLSVMGEKRHVHLESWPLQPG